MRSATQKPRLDHPRASFPNLRAWSPDAAVLRVVREEEPPRPSVKLSTTQARASIAARRGTEPGKLAQLLRGELDWVVMKSLEKDRNRR